MIYNIARLHGVAPLIYINLNRCSGADIPAEALKQFKTALMQNMMTKSHFANAMNRAVSFFKERSINVMFIKGAALDILVYEQPFYTIYSDADLVLDIKRDAITDRENKIFMDYFHRSRVEYDFFSHHDVTMNGTLPVDFAEIWNRATKIEYQHQAVFVMSPEDMLLSLCINSCRKRFFRLKSICDLAETINNYPDFNWNRFVQIAKKYDCQSIAYTALWITKNTVGSSIPEEIFEALNTSPMRARTIHYLSGRMSLNSFVSLYSGINVLDRHIDWPLLLSYVSLKPYQIWRRTRFVSQTNARGDLRGR